MAADRRQRVIEFKAELSEVNTSIAKKHQLATALAKQAAIKGPWPQDGAGIVIMKNGAPCYLFGGRELPECYTEY
jgi:hypothetical protein